MTIPKPIKLPKQINTLTVVRTKGAGLYGSMALVRCERGHEEWRRSHILRKTMASGQTSWCKMCPRPLTERQRNVLLLMRANEQESCAGTSRARLKTIMGRDCQSALSELVAKGFLEKEGPAYWLTDEALDEIEGPGGEVAAE